MIYYLGYTYAMDWRTNFNDSILSELRRRKIPHQVLPNSDWSKKLSPDEEDFILSISSRDEDIWFIAWVYHPIMKKLQFKKGKKVSRIAGLACNPFEKAFIYGFDIKDALKGEEYFFSLYDVILFNSHYGLEMAAKQYPRLSHKFFYVGRPTDFERLSPYKAETKKEKTIAINHRFSIEKMAIIELELSKQLIDKGYTVYHFMGPEQKSDSAIFQTLIDMAEKNGVQFLVTTKKEDYYRLLSQCSMVVSTSMSDMLPMSMFEAIYLGLIPIAPNHLSFTEFIHKDNLYEPFDLKQIIGIIEKSPLRDHPVFTHDKRVVMDKILSVLMEG
ncbi:glycosyltransferase [Microaerobacter geothermalis]|nr:glycosyltransferase [Microaerobacter geothermalis]